MARRCFRQSAAIMVNRYKIILYLYTGLDALPTERGGVTHISKDNVREIEYYQANCMYCFSTKIEWAYTPYTPLDPGLVYLTIDGNQRGSNYKYFFTN